MNSEHVTQKEHQDNPAPLTGWQKLRKWLNGGDIEYRYALQPITHRQVPLAFSGVVLLSIALALALYSILQTEIAQLNEIGKLSAPAWLILLCLVEFRVWSGLVRMRPVGHCLAGLGDPFTHFMFVVLILPAVYDSDMYLLYWGVLALGASWLVLLMIVSPYMPQIPEIEENTKEKGAIRLAWIFSLLVPPFLVYPAVAYFINGLNEEAKYFSHWGPAGFMIGWVGVMVMGIYLRKKMWPDAMISQWGQWRDGWDPRHLVKKANKDCADAH